MGEEYEEEEKGEEDEEEKQTERCRKSILNFDPSHSAPMPGSISQPHRGFSQGGNKVSFFIQFLRHSIPRKQLVADSFKLAAGSAEKI